jgi:aspartyl-tRNA(Asn)/glutamyl-tRNA(Gln) amidotransferase subunit C
MKITDKEVRHIARLSRLFLTEEEVTIFKSQLNTILDYVEQLNSLDTSEVEPTAHVIPLKNIMRDDIAEPSLSQQEILRNAPDATDKFFRVPKIIE